MSNLNTNKCEKNAEGDLADFDNFQKDKMSSDNALIQKNYAKTSVKYSRFGVAAHFNCTAFLICLSMFMDDITNADLLSQNIGLIMSCASVAFLSIKILFQGKFFGLMSKFESLLNKSGQVLLLGAMLVAVQKIVNLIYHNFTGSPTAGESYNDKLLIVGAIFFTIQFYDFSVRKNAQQISSDVFYSFITILSGSLLMGLSCVFFALYYQILKTNPEFYRILSLLRNTTPSIENTIFYFTATILGQSLFCLFMASYNKSYNNLKTCYVLLLSLLFGLVILQNGGFYKLTGDYTKSMTTNCQNQLANTHDSILKRSGVCSNKYLWNLQTTIYPYEEKLIWENYGHNFGMPQYAYLNDSCCNSVLDYYNTPFIILIQILLTIIGTQVVLTLLSIWSLFMGTGSSSEEDLDTEESEGEADQKLLNKKQNAKIAKVMFIVFCVICCIGFGMYCFKNEKTNGQKINKNLITFTNYLTSSSQLKNDSPNSLEISKMNYSNVLGNVQGVYESKNLDKTVKVSGLINKGLNNKNCGDIYVDATTFNGKLLKRQRINSNCGFNIRVPFTEYLVQKSLEAKRVLSATIDAESTSDTLISSNVVTVTNGETFSASNSSIQNVKVDDKTGKTNCSQRVISKAYKNGKEVENINKKVK